MNDERDPNGYTPRQLIARGIMWFLIWMGFGGCVFLSNYKTPLITTKDSVTIEAKK